MSSSSLGEKSFSSFTKILAASTADSLSAWPSRRARKSSNPGMDLSRINAGTLESPAEPDASKRLKPCIRRYLHFGASSFTQTGSSRPDDFIAKIRLSRSCSPGQERAKLRSVRSISPVLRKVNRVSVEKIPAFIFIFSLRIFSLIIDNHLKTTIIGQFRIIILVFCIDKLISNFYLNISLKL